MILFHGRKLDSLFIQHTEAIFCAELEPGNEATDLLFIPGM